MHHPHQAACTVQGLVSEHPSLKIKRQIVQFGCDHLVQGPVERERDMRNKGRRVGTEICHRTTDLRKGVT